MRWNNVITVSESPNFYPQRTCYLHIKKLLCKQKDMHTIALNSVIAQLCLGQFSLFPGFSKMPGTQQVPN